MPMTGHLLDLAGAIEAIVCINAVSENAIPPTIHSIRTEPEFANKFDFTLGKAKQRIVNFALSNTFGFGGHIASSIFKKIKS